MILYENLVVSKKLLRIEFVCKYTITPAVTEGEQVQE